eukprot:TRINITY_DN31591_c0_g1_i1.p1 TRINITY_DN31591_c0_g1~~TRINITY_DN31591_c0_g1_i1.p1  ORF type:complete len:345 (-),score=41.09 TRINITY_DN31591_c0_g1_i1:9-1016(-)
MTEVVHEEDLEAVESAQPAARNRNETFSSDDGKRGQWLRLFVAVLGEHLGTFLLLFVIMAASLNLNRLGLNKTITPRAIATGFAATGFSYAFADVSGAHFNPAVTLATIVIRKTSILRGILYIAVQLAASLWATLWIGILFGFAEVPALNVMPNDTGVELFQAFLMEGTLSFILCYVVLATAFDQVERVDTSLSTALATANKDNPLAGLTIYSVAGTSKSGFAPIAIGFAVGLLTMIGGGVSGGAFNPARVFGPALVTGKIFTEGSLWVYWIGDSLGAALAGLTQHFFHALHNFETENLTIDAIANAFLPHELVNMAKAREEEYRYYIDGPDLIV